MIADDIRDIRERHQSAGRIRQDGTRADFDMCETCETPLPCDAIEALDMLAAERAARAADTKEQAFRVLMDRRCSNCPHTYGEHGPNDCCVVCEEVGFPCSGFAARSTDRPEGEGGSELPNEELLSDA